MWRNTYGIMKLGSFCHHKAIDVLTYLALVCHHATTGLYTVALVNHKVMVVQSRRC